MEFLDTLTEKGEPTGIQKLRPDVHRDGDWHRCVHVWIVNEKYEILIQKRSPNKDLFPNLWDISVAGHIGAGQTSLETALREVQEEIGVSIPAEHLQFLFTTQQEIVQELRGEKTCHREFQDVYLAKLDIDRTNLHLQQAEVSEIQFIPVSEFIQQIETQKDKFAPHPEEYQRLCEILTK